LTQQAGGWWQGQRPGPIAFGLGLLSDLPLPGAWQARAPGGEPVLRLGTASPQEVSERWSGLHAVGWEGTVDGARFTVQRGVAGDHRFVHGASCERARAVHHLTADSSELWCAPADLSDPSWWRVVLDSVLFTVALIEGYEALHAAAVVTPGRDGVIAITAPMGGGKSTLLSELLREELTLVADDVVVLAGSGSGSAPMAHPAPPLVTLPSARISALRTAHGGTPAPICVLGEESWVGVPTHPEPLPLRSLVVLERSPGGQLSLSRVRSPLSHLMSSLMSFPRTRERERARFELASEIAASVGIWKLTAGLDTPPQALAATLLEGEAASRDGS
jgi:hypothetical protein